LLQKSFWGDERKLLEPLMRFTHGDVRDHIVSSKIDHGFHFGVDVCIFLICGADRSFSGPEVCHNQTDPLPTISVRAKRPHLCSADGAARGEIAITRLTGGITEPPHRAEQGGKNHASAKSSEP
jgi:hypothetical protein